MGCATHWEDLPGDDGIFGFEFQRRFPGVTKLLKKTGRAERRAQHWMH
jgi:hypothetical protein